MLGAVIGDIVGSRFEFNNNRNKDFELFHKDCVFTDDSVMTIAVADAFLDAQPTHSSHSTPRAKYPSQYASVPLAT